MGKPEIDVSPDPVALASRMAEWIVQRVGGTTGPFALNLSGGSTPKRLYELLATNLYRDEIDWGRVHVFFGDERFVPHDHKDSNFKMANDALLSKVPIPPDNIHPVQTGLASPEAAAADYEDALKVFYGKTTLDLPRPLFAFTLLGLGEDGHTASLFPGTAALEERDKWVTAVIGAKPEPRITMTYPILDASAVLAFLTAGAGKKDILRRVLDRDPALPASLIDPQGEFYVFCDEAAVAA